MILSKSKAHIETERGKLNETGRNSPGLKIWLVARLEKAFKSFVEIILEEFF